MEEIIILQMDNYQNLTKARRNFKKSPKERITETYVQVRLESIEQLWAAFVAIHRELLGKYGGKIKEHEYIKQDIYEQAEEFFIDYKTELKTILNGYNINKTETLAVAKQAGSVGMPHNSLPKIIIPKFSGKYTEWVTFRDLFLSLIHNNASLDLVQKMHYLKGYLLGEAEQLLRQIPIAADNYSKCWKLLEDRYNNKQYLSNCILKRLLSQKSHTVESAQGLKDLIDTSTDCLNALSNIGVDVTNWDIIVIHIITLKLDGESRKQWELHVTSSIAADNLPTYEQFKSFITNRFRALEFVGQKSVNKAQQSNMVVQKPRSMHATSSEQPTYQCPNCSESHKLYLCKKFHAQDSDARREFVLKNRICFNCLGVNHSAKSCKNPIKCRICRRHHHTLLHPSTASKEKLMAAMLIEDSGEELAEESEEESAEERTEEPAEEIQVMAASVRNKTVLLATALVHAETKNGNSITVRALLDQGSQASFVSEAVVQLLRLKKTPSRGIISGVGGAKAVTSKAVVHLKLTSRVEPHESVQVKAHVLKSITSYLPGQEVETLEWIKSAKISLADPQYQTPNKIDILLGAEIYSQILKEGVLKDPNGLMVAQATTFGWIISGLVSSAQQGKIVVMHSAVTTENDILKKFWELESESVYEEKKRLTEEEKQCEEFFVKTTTRDSEGRYIVKLPFKNDIPACKEGSTKLIAVKRLQSLEKRLAKNKVLKEEYQKTFEEYLRLNYMVPVIENEKDKDSVYLPYHEVIREDKDTTKVRIVMNASSKGTNGVSLNDDLMVGPTLQMDLRHIIMRWRRHPVVLVADIEKMYHQIKLDENDANFQRILWRSSPEKEITDYKLVRVLFGTACAPHLAVRSLMQVVADEGHLYPEAAERVVVDFYMDDLLTGCETVDEGIEVYRQMKALLKTAGFNMTKWSSNSEELLVRIKEGQLEEDKNMNLEIKMDTIIKILGLTWNRCDDSYHYVVSLPTLQRPVTKRNIIADIARLFDPLGWVAPVIIVAKIIIQKLWLTGIKWDEEVPESLLKEWMTYREGLKFLEQIKIPRHLGCTVNDTQIELHGYSDASQVAYAAVVYVRTVGADGVHVKLVAAKTKVAPIKQVSIPRLELCGAVLLAKLLAEVGTIMEVPKNNWVAWTDSTVVLAWLNSHPSRWKTFIANRVTMIMGTLEPHQWNHVSSKSNPADVASRGLSPSEFLKSSLWLNGPEMLKNKEIKKEKPKQMQTNLEEATRKVCMHISENETNLFNKYSSLTKLIRVVAYCRRFLNMKKPKIERHKSVILSRGEMDEALEVCIKRCQEEYFAEEIKSVTGRKSLKRTSKLLSLNPFLDDRKVLRVGGRLENLKVSENKKHQILIPNEGKFTRLLIDNAHKSTLHGGPQLILGFLYAKYWIVGAKRLVKSYVRQCTICVKNAAVIKHQLMGQLPSVRVTPGRAFKKSGVDFAGPIDFRTTKGRGHRSYKGYICLFICMVTRAVHIEAVSDLTTPGFLAAFKRFVARRGHCTDMYSDNGTNFVGAARELKILFDSEQSTVGREIAENLATNGTAWHFIPPRAPNFGGLWEAAIKSTKFHLKRVIGNAKLTYEEMSTVLAQVESCLNSRPLSRIEGEADVESILTPGHFLVGEPLVTAPDRNFESANLSTLRRWQLTQRMLQEFWRCWSRDYVHNMQQRYKWRDQNPEPREGDVVLIKEDDLPPSRWLLGKIVTKHPDAHNVTRVVTLRTKNSLIKRPISKLVVLPVCD